MELELEQLKQEFREHRHTKLDSKGVSYNDLDNLPSSPTASSLGLGTNDNVEFNNVKANGQLYSPEHDNGNSGTSKTIDWNNGNIQFLTLTGNCTLTFSNPIAGTRYVLMVKQGSGPYTLTWPTIKWENGTTPTLTVTNNKIDVFVFVYSGVNGSYLGSYAYNF